MIQRPGALEQRNSHLTKFSTQTKIFIYFTPKNNFLKAKIFASVRKEDPLTLPKKICFGAKKQVFMITRGNNFSSKKFLVLEQSS